MKRRKMVLPDDGSQVRLQVCTSCAAVNYGRQNSCLRCGKPLTDYKAPAVRQNLTRYCNRCGKPITTSGNDRFCRHCGAPLPNIR
jgi:predicted amidophosphoribosyltransferase